MKRKELIEILNKWYSTDSINSILSGRRFPSMQKAQLMYKKYKVPLEAWIDIKSYLQNNDTKTKKIMK